ncbi:MAG: ABC transporter permease [Lachnospiraceae bacterium]|nr:ABC transporter permease [Lachnospiraceae bacterium]
MRFYLRLALDGMKKNRQLYRPYLLTCIGMVMMFYILASLSFSPAILGMRSGDTVSIILVLGTIVIGIFSLLFLAYTNSFLIRRRNREFGLYNILGMNKGNISIIILLETLITALFTITAGVLLGILFSKLAELFLLRMSGADVDFLIRISPVSILASFIVFGAIFFLLLIVSLARVRLSNPLSLLKSEAAGEKPPKANLLLALAGVVILGLAYYFAVSIETPLSALALFFAAVIMVIVATYLLFIAGSVALCRILQKNKNYYYKASHFVSVSSMAFRMKRNGAGLASICILATMVLVMISSTGCLYFGSEDALRGMQPYDMTATVFMDSAASCTSENAEALRSIVLNETKGKEKNVAAYSFVETYGLLENGELDLDGAKEASYLTNSDPNILGKIRTVILISLADYEQLTGKRADLADDEILVWSSGKPYPFDKLTVKGCRELEVKDTLADPPVRVSTEDTIVTALIVVIPNWYDYAAELSGLDDERRDLSFVRQRIAFDLSDVDAAEDERLLDAISDAGDERIGADPDCGWLYVRTESYLSYKGFYYDLNGSFFFLGIVLSIIFIAAAALIIYYKQLSEGYEDHSRFAIMQKVGMTHAEIKSTINTQVLTVFFAPLLLAGLHLCFAFPFVEKLIRLFGVSNRAVLILSSVACFLTFALLYILFYRGTARTYFNIVSASENA